MRQIDEFTHILFISRLFRKNWNTILCPCCPITLQILHFLCEIITQRTRETEAMLRTSDDDDDGGVVGLC